MIRLIYVSKRREYVSVEEIVKFVAAAAVSNKKRSLTGILSYWDTGFFQILEGEEETVLSLFKNKILPDDRHSNVTVISQKPVNSRDYPDWPMKLLNLDEVQQAGLFPVKSMLISFSEKLMGITGNGNLGLNGSNKDIGSSRPVSKVTDKVVFFSDVVSFSSLSQALEPGLVVELLNKYMNVVTSHVIANGGKVSKLLGDGVMAYFDEHQADHAIDASLGILAELQSIRLNAEDGSAEKILHSGIGLARGPVIEGDIGSDANADYTIIGDSVNLASRLESLTRSQKLSLIFSREVKDKLNGKWKVFEMGKHMIKGKPDPLVLYSINSPVTKKEATGIELEWEIGNYLRVISPKS